MQLSSLGGTVDLTPNGNIGTLYYLQISPDPNAGASWGLSDPATHLTDNYYKQSGREVFELTSAGQLYSVTNNAWYGTQTGATSGKLFWDTRMVYANTTFSGTPVNDGTGRVQLFLQQSTTASSPDVFCVANVASGDGNSATGYHVYFAPPGTTSASTGNCIITSLYLSPTSNGRIGAREVLHLIDNVYAEDSDLESL